jgi:hypothetical protein
MGFSFIGKGEGKREKGKGNTNQPFPFSLLPFPFPFSLLLVTALLCLPASAADYTHDLNEFINIEMKPWVSSDIVIDSLNKQNEEQAALLESNLLVMDNNWRSEYRKVNQPTIGPVLASELSQFLKKKAVEGEGVYTELIIVDAKGLNIAQTVISENYYNAGKPRWEKTFRAKSYAPYISEIYYSDETSKFQVEVSFLIVSDGQPVGIVVAGIDVEQLDDWKKRRK